MLRILAATMLVLANVALAESPALAPEDAKKFVGQELCVRGVVTQVAEAKGHVFINFGGVYPNQVFTGFVPGRAVDHFENGLLQSLEGKTIQLCGLIKLYKGKPEIEVTDRSQIFIVGVD